jgi:uncharacterized protein (DUF4213/DUF364 family)
MTSAVMRIPIEAKMIVDDLLQETRAALAERIVADVRIGLGYTAVVLDDGGCGLAGTVVEGSDWRCTLLAEAGELIGRPALEAAQMALAKNPVASGVGIATINAVLNRAGEASPDVLDVLPVDGAKVAMVGMFEPYVNRLRQRAAELHVFERRPVAPEVLPEQEAERILPECDVAILTSVTLVNKTLDHLLELARGEVALLGPTTPMSATFASHSVGHLFGVVVEDVERIEAIVSQAGGTRRFGSAARKVYHDLRGSPE